MMSHTDAVAAPKRGRPGLSRQDVLDAAVAAFIEHGYDATSMEMLSSRLGLSKAAIYHHFPAKVELLRAALDEALGGLEDLLRQPGATGGGRSESTAEQRLAFVMSGAVHVLIARLPYVTLLLRVRGNSEVERAALTRRREFDRAVTALVIEARNEGSVRSDIDPSVVTRLIFGMINSIVEWYRPEGPESADQLASDVLAVALEGLSAS